MSWRGFAALVLGYVRRPEHSLWVPLLHDGPRSGSGFGGALRGGRLLNDFFFSGHTLTTVGYGTLAPHGIPGNLAAILEALVGLLSFSIITGLLVARASRPSARIRFSPKRLSRPTTAQADVPHRQRALQQPDRT